MRIKLLRSIGKLDESLLKAIPEPSQAALLAAVEGQVLEVHDDAAQELLNRTLAEKTTEEITPPKMHATAPALLPGQVASPGHAPVHAPASQPKHAK